MEEMQSITELAENLQEYKTQLLAVEELLSNEPDNEEYSQMKQELLEVISMTEELINGDTQVPAKNLENSRASDGENEAGVSPDTEKNAKTPQKSQGTATTLHSAARNGDLSSLAQLVAGGSDVNAKDKLRRTALHLASWAGQVEAIEYLISCGAKVPMEAADGVTALQFACQKGNLAAAKSLLKAGANPRSFSSKGMTPLHYAAQCGSLELVQLLLKKKAIPTSTNKQGKTPADLCKDDEIRTILEAAATSSQGTGDANLDDDEPNNSIAKDISGAETTALKPRERKGNIRKRPADDGVAHTISDPDCDEKDALSDQKGTKKSKKSKKGKGPIVQSHLMAEDDDAENF